MKHILRTVACFIPALLMTVTAVTAQLPERKLLTPTPDVMPELYSPAIQVGKTLYIAGTGDGRPTSDTESYDVKTIRCLESIRSKLALAGLDYRNIVQAWVMFEDMDRQDEVRAAFSRIFPDNPPAGTMFGATEIPGPSQIEITAIAYSDLSERKIIGDRGGDLFSPGVLAGNTLYVSGQNSMTPDGKLPATFEEQARQSMTNLGSILSAAGLDYRHVVWTNVYMDNYDNYGVANKVYSDYFEYGNEPARLSVFVDVFPEGTHMKTACIATTDLSQRKVVRPASMKYGPDERVMSASPGVWAGNTLYLSQQTGYSPGEAIDTTDLETQFRRMIRNQLDVLREAGLTPTDLVWAHVFLRSIDDYQPMNGLYREYFHSPPPVRTCFQPNNGYEKDMAIIKSVFIAAKTRK